MTDRFLETVRRVKLKSRMLEICKSGSVRGIEVFSHGLNIVTLRKPKGRRNREYKRNLKEKTILCLLDSQNKSGFQFEFHSEFQILNSEFMQNLSFAIGSVDKKFIEYNML